MDARTTRPSRPRGPDRRAWTVRLALWSARHRWPVLAGWLVLTIGLFAASQLAGGIRAVNPTGGAISQTEASRAAAAMLSGAGSDGSEELDLVVTSRRFGATDTEFRAVVADVLSRLSPVATGLTDPYFAPPQAGFLAADGTSVRLAGRLEGDAAALEARARQVQAALDALAAAHPDFEIHAVSTTLLTDQMAVEIGRDMDASLWLSLPATFIILVVAFGALVAAGVPLLLAMTSLLGAFGLYGFYSTFVEPVSPYGAQFVVLIGLAVAVDYSLFVVTRFRAERSAGRDRLAAIEVASATSGRAVAFSGVAVMISLAALLLIPDAMFRSIAIGTIAVIAVAIAGSLVFLPAVLALLGDRVNRGRVPFLAGRRLEGRQVWTRIVRVAMARPVVATVLATGALLALASPMARLRLGESEITAFPERIDAVRAVRLLNDHWPQGALLRLDVAATGASEPGRAAAIDRLAPALLAIPGLSGPPVETASADGSARSVSVIMAGGANDDSNWRIVRQVRESIVPELFGAGAGDASGVYVGGGAATSLDQTALFGDGMARILVFVLGLSLVLLLLVFRSIVIPLKAILLNLLATGAAFGAMVLVFQDGWLCAQLGIRPADAIQNFVPVFVFTCLFGLSMDYEVFILARVREGYDAGLSTTEAVARGIGHTAGTVTSAAAIMVVVFAVFLTLPLPIARELGLGLMVAVFVDATLIRTVLLPATMRLLGDWNWWLPGFLGWLPRLSIEGETPGRAAEMLPSGTATAPR